MKPEGQLEKLFRLQEQLYDAGARNFVFIDVPPVNRFPGGRECFSVWLSASLTCQWLKRPHAERTPRSR